nr:piggyBac transposable element-derived protein 4-like isoform X2 [Megalopta genalis]
MKIEDFYGLFVTDEMFERISEQTNIYAAQASTTSKHLQQWVPTNKDEMKQMFGLILWMGLVKLPSMYLYWSQDPLFIQTFPQRVMSRDRFEILMSTLHFANNTEDGAFDRLSKVQFIVDELNKNFKKYYDPAEILCIDESLIPFRGQIRSGRYLKKERRKRCVKIFKLCCDNGYTYSFRVHAGKALEKEDIASTNVTMNLCKDVFYKGHTLCTDNWYTSVDLANKLVTKNMHLVGTLRLNCKGIPNEVLTTELKRGEVVAKENSKGITVLKWKDKRDVLVLSTKHSCEMENVTTKRGVCCRPKILIEYNKGKTSVDLSDRMSAYSGPPSKTMKWYRKLALELFLNIAVANALIMFKDVTRRKMSITTFRKQLADALTRHSERETPIRVDTRRNVHQLEKKEGKAHKVRKYCLECYRTNTEIYGRDLARKLTRRVVTFCNMCNSEPHLCLECFNKLH